MGPALAGPGALRRQQGFKSDETRPNVWRYRDYVIDSFNQDKPYDRFVKEQIAGDELYPDDPAAMVATGFNRLWPDESNLANPMLRRQEILDDITDTVGVGVHGHDLRLRPLPRPQVRSDPAEGLLPAAGVLRQHHAMTIDASLLKPATEAHDISSNMPTGTRKTRDIRAEMQQLLEPGRAST